MNTHLTIDLTGEIRHANAEVNGSIRQLCLFSLAGDRIGGLPPDIELPPAATVLQYGAGPSEQVDSIGSVVDPTWSETKDHFPEYCARYAVLGMVTACEVYLQRLLFIARLGCEFSQSKEPLRGSDFYRTRERCLKEARRTSVDGVALEVLSAVGYDTSAVPGLEWFRGVYALRRCLVHRNGRVSEQDVGANGLLEVKWKKVVMFVEDVEITELPFTVEAGQTVSMKMVDNLHSWRAGENVQLSAEDCQHIGLSLTFFAKQMEDKLNEGLVTIMGQTADPS